MGNLVTQAQGHQTQLDTVTGCRGTDGNGHIHHRQDKALTELAVSNEHLGASVRADAGELAQNCAAVDIDKLTHDERRREDRRDHLQAALQLWQKRCDLQSQQVKQREQKQAQESLLLSSIQVLAAQVSAFAAS